MEAEQPGVQRKAAPASQRKGQRNGGNQNGWLRAMEPMLTQNRGRIIFISSESGLKIPTEMIHYGMSKTAQLAVSRGLAETTAGTGVTVNSVLPGPTKSEGVTTFVEQMAKEGGQDSGEFERAFFENVRPTSILKRFITPDEIAAVVTFVCSPLAAAFNGTSLKADGGVVRSIA